MLQWYHEISSFHPTSHKHVDCIWPRVPNMWFKWGGLRWVVEKKVAIHLTWKGVIIYGISHLIYSKPSDGQTQQTGASSKFDKYFAEKFIIAWHQSFRSPLTLLQKGQASYWYRTTSFGRRSGEGGSLDSATVTKAMEKESDPARPRHADLDDTGGTPAGALNGEDLNRGLEEAEAAAPPVAAGKTVWFPAEAVLLTWVSRALEMWREEERRDGALLIIIVVKMVSCFPGHNTAATEESSLRPSLPGSWFMAASSGSGGARKKDSAVPRSTVAYVSIKRGKLMLVSEMNSRPQDGSDFRETI